MEPRLNWLDRLIIAVAPAWGTKRARARLFARHFEAAAAGRRTDGWSRGPSDANAAASGATLGRLRGSARDLVRNNPWARRGLRRLVSNLVGWGIRPQATGRGAERAMALWAKWAETTQCDAAGLLTFYGLQALVMRAIIEGGEVIVRRRRRRPEDGLAVPFQLQVLEPDYIDTSIDGIKGPGGGNIIQGVEFDLLGRRVAYWLFDQHPGGRSFVTAQSRRVDASNILHIFDVERAGQVRGTSWFAPVDVRLHDFDEFEDATLMKQKIAASMAAFVTDLDSTGVPLGQPGQNNGTDTDTFEPGMIINLPPGKQVTVANPPASSDHQAFSATSLRGVAAGLGTTYEDLTGDYSQVNFSSARMARIAHNADLTHWRWNMLIPMLCAPVWAWFVDAMIIVGEDVEDSPATWTPPAMPMIDPSNEGQALSRNVRAGVMTHDEMVREQGYDPETFWREYEAGLKRLDKHGIVLDSDVRRTNTSGQLQTPPASSSAQPKSSNDDPATVSAIA